jgi:hypothetical protein
MRMRVCYLGCHEAGLCCYLVMRIEKLLRPLQLFYFHLWPIYWLSLVHYWSTGSTRAPSGASVNVEGVYGYFCSDQADTDCGGVAIPLVSNYIRNVGIVAKLSLSFPRCREIPGLPQDTFPPLHYSTLCSVATDISLEYVVPSPPLCALKWRPCVCRGRVVPPSVDSSRLSWKILHIVTWLSDW